MFKSRFLKLLVIPVVLGIFVSCGGSDNDTTPVAPPAPAAPEPVAASFECPSVTNSAGTAVVQGTDAAGGDTCTYTGTYTDSFTMASEATHVLSGPVNIGDDTATPTLTVEAGTTIRGESGPDSLNILRGAKIIAAGTAAAPIIMTSTSDDGTLAADAQGQWGGLQIMGRATLNCTDAEKNSAGVCERAAEGYSSGITVPYGGTNDLDSSGTLSYVVVKYAGNQITPTNELNGIAFYAVGNSTSVSYIRVHNNADDGIEFFGGTVSFKYAYLTGNQDDSFDYTNGWRGNAQWVIIDQNTPDPATATSNRPDNGMEFDNNGDANNALPRSNPTISNFLILGNTVAHGELVHTREGTNATLANGIIVDASNLGPCWEVDNDATVTAASDGTNAYGKLVAASVAMACGTEKYGSSDTMTSTWAAASTNSITDITSSLTGYVNGANESAVTVNTSVLVGAFWDTPTEIGAIPSGGTDWTAGWSDL